MRNLLIAILLIVPLIGADIEALQKEKEQYKKTKRVQKVIKKADFIYIEVVFKKENLNLSKEIEKEFGLEITKSILNKIYIYKTKKKLLGLPNKLLGKIKSKSDVVDAKIYKEIKFKRY